MPLGQLKLSLIKKGGVLISGIVYYTYQFRRDQAFCPHFKDVLIEGFPVHTLYYKLVIMNTTIHIHFVLEIFV